MKPVAISGGGITGLTAGFYLQRAGIPVTVYEATGRVVGAGCDNCQALEMTV